MHVVIARAAGFLGARLVERYLAGGHHVTVVDDLRIGALTSLAHLLQHPHFRFEVAEVHEVAGVVLHADLRLDVAADASAVEIFVGPLDVRRACIANAYGPGMRGDENVVAGLLAQAFSGRPLGVPGNGPLFLSSVYVDDAVEGVVRLAGRAGAAGLTVDLGSVETPSLLEVAKRIAAFAGVSVSFTAQPSAAVAPVRALPDVDAARELLGWRPHVALREGIARTFAAATARLRPAS